MKVKHYFLMALLFALFGCKNQKSSSSIDVSLFGSIDLGKTLLLEHTDARFGEWGGNTFQITIYRIGNNETLFADYKELEGSPKPPPPPQPGTLIEDLPRWYFKPIIQKKLKVKLLESDKTLVEQAILELVKENLRNDKFLGHPGTSNYVEISDSSLMIYDYPSSAWPNFQKLKQSILNR